METHRARGRKRQTGRTRTRKGEKNGEAVNAHSFFFGTRGVSVKLIKFRENFYNTRPLKNVQVYTSWQFMLLHGRLPRPRSLSQSPVGRRQGTTIRASRVWYTQLHTSLCGHTLLYAGCLSHFRAGITVVKSYRDLHYKRFSPSLAVRHRVRTRECSVGSGFLRFLPS